MRVIRAGKWVIITWVISRVISWLSYYVGSKSRATYYPLSDHLDDLADFSPWCPGWCPGWFPGWCPGRWGRLILAEKETSGDMFIVFFFFGRGGVAYPSAAAYWFSGLTHLPARITLT